MAGSAGSAPGCPRPREAALPGVRSQEPAQPRTRAPLPLHVSTEETREAGGVGRGTRAEPAPRARARAEHKRHGFQRVCHGPLARMAPRVQAHPGPGPSSRKGPKWLIGADREVRPCDERAPRGGALSPSGEPARGGAAEVGGRRGAGRPGSAHAQPCQPAGPESGPRWWEAQVGLLAEKRCVCPPRPRDLPSKGLLTFSSAPCCPHPRPSVHRSLPPRGRCRGLRASRAQGAAPWACCVICMS